MAKLTDRRCKTAPNGTDEGDDIVKGLRLYVSNSGLRSFRYRYSHPATSKTVKLVVGHYPSMTLQAARAEVLRLKELRNAGHDPRAVLNAERGAVIQATREAQPAKPAKSKSPRSPDHQYEPGTVGDLARKWEIVNRPEWAPSTTKEITRIVNKEVLPRWGARPVEELRRAEIVDARDAIVARGRATLSNRFKWVVLSILNYAVDQELIDANPAIGIKNKKERPRTNRLDDVGIRKLYDWLPESGLSDAMQDAIRFVLLTGARIGETVAATPAEFDLENRRWTKPGAHTKTGQDGDEAAHVVFLSDEAMAIVKRRIALGGSHLWPAAKGTTGHLRGDSINTALARALKGAPVPYFTPHDLRRSVGSGMGGLRISREAIDRVLDHKPQDVTGRHYDQHHRDDEARDAWMRWGDHLSALRQPNGSSMRRGV